MVVMEMTEETSAVTPDTSSTPVEGNSEAVVAETGQTTSNELIAGDNSAETQADSSVAKATEGETGTIPVVNKAETARDVDRTQENLQRYQAERDRLEQYAKELIKKVAPYVEFDDYGNPLGPRKQVVQVSPEDQKQKINELVEASQNGDPNATHALLSMFEEQAVKRTKDEIRQELRQTESYKQEIDGLKKDFPDLYNKDGGVNEASPLYKETFEVMKQRPYLRYESPRDLRVAALEAENRLIKRGLPELENKIRQETLNKSKTVASSVGTASTTGSAVQVDDLKDALSAGQIAQLRREGYDDAGIKRVAKTFKQAMKESNKSGGLYL